LVAKKSPYNIAYIAKVEALVPPDHQTKHAQFPEKPQGVVTGRASNPVEKKSLR
jgi:hypothetical protein